VTVTGSGALRLLLGRLRPFNPAARLQLGQWATQPTVPRHISSDEPSPQVT
jgi:hypothetical protein